MQTIRRLLVWLTLGQLMLVCLAQAPVRADAVQVAPYPGPARITFANYADYEGYASQRVAILEARRDGLLAQGKVDHYRRRRVFGFILLGLGATLVVGAGLNYLGHTGDGGDAYRNDTLKAYTRGFSGAGLGLFVGAAALLIANNTTDRRDGLHQVSIELEAWKVSLSRQRRFHARLPSLSFSLSGVGVRF